MKSKSENRKWKQTTVIFIILTIVSMITSVFFFTKTDYWDRIVTKLGWGGYNPSSREEYIIDGWSASLAYFDADVYFLGDSITYGGDWASYFPDSTVCKLAVPGDDIAQVSYRADMAVNSQTRKVFVMVGVNNLSRGNFEKSIANDYEILIEKLKMCDCEVYIQSILPTREPSEVDNKRVARANEIIKEIAEAKGCIYVDLYSAFLDGNHEMDKSLTKDGIHLNENGYKVWVEQIRDLVE